MQGGKEERRNREAARNFQDLIVWQKSHEFVLLIYRFTDSFPKREMYGLTSQMRRAAVSIPANIAEGFKKKSPKDKLRFFNISQGSLEECRYYLILAQDLNYGNSTALMSKLEEVSRLLISYSKAILRRVQD
ncbi:MAG: four helix bundle protein [Cyanobacteria bacterium P01_G01_bin.49]